MTEGEKLFYGDGRTGENPHDYKKRVMMRFVGKKMDEAEKVEALGLGMASSSDADEWFDELTPEQKASWATVSAAFDAKWKKRKLAAKTVQEKKNELLEEVLAEEEVGKRSKSDGLEEYGHVRWAYRIETLGEALDSGGLLISTIREKMPTIMKDLVKDNHATWASFTDAVRAVTSSDIKEARAKENRMRAVETSRNPAPVQPQSPTAPLRYAMLHTSLGPASQGQQAQILRNNSPVPMMLPLQAGGGANPFMSNTPLHQNSIFARPAAGFVPTTPSPQRTFRADTARLADLQRNIPVHHPNTDTGKAAYARQITDWTTRNGPNGKPNEYRPYPLTPGTAALNAGECFRCAVVGHMGAECTGQSIPELEKKWRSIATSIYRGAARDAAAAPAPVNLLPDAGVFYLQQANGAFSPGGYGNEQYQGAYISGEYVADDQGNGQGSSM